MILHDGKQNLEREFRRFIQSTYLQADFDRRSAAWGLMELHAAAAAVADTISLDMEAGQDTVLCGEAQETVLDFLQAAVTRARCKAELADLEAAYTWAVGSDWPLCEAQDDVPGLAALWERFTAHREAQRAQSDCQAPGPTWQPPPAYGNCLN